MITLFHTGFSTGVDGPGQRLVLYFKGCNLHCPWCAAPESIAPAPEVLFYPQRADDPALLAAACPFGAVALQSGTMRRDTARCRRCADTPCARSGCHAFERVGEQRSVADLRQLARRYYPFFHPDGGVTVGGGEPTCQFEELARLLTALRTDGIHTALETNGTHPRLAELYPVLDLLYIDFKHPDDIACMRITGAGNTVVLQNIRQRLAVGGGMVVRLPLVQGYNTDEGTLQQFGAILAAIGPVTVELLPFHPRGAVKWKACGQTMPAQPLPVPPRGLAQARAILAGCGLKLTKSD